MRGGCALVLAAISIVSGCQKAKRDPPAGPPPASVEVAPVQRGTDLQELRMLVGTVVPEKMATVGSAVSGRVIEFPLNEGDRVSANGTLAQLLTDTVQLELRAAQAELDLRTARLEELRNGTRPEELAQAAARAAAARAAVEYAHAQLQRAETLRTSGSAISEGEFQQVRSAALDARETLNERIAAYDLAVAGPRREAKKQAEAEVAMQEALVAKIEDQIKKHRIVSRFDGYLVTEHTEVGQWVNAGDPIADVAMLTPIDVLFDVPESDVAFLKRGETIELTVPALGKSYTGSIQHIVPRADPRSRTFPVKVEVDNRSEGDEPPPLKSGMLVRASFAAGPRHDGWLVPKDAVVPQPMGSLPLLVVVDSSGPDAEAARARIVRVQTGVALGEMIEVVGDIQEGDEVVVLGNERLRAGQSLIVQSRRPARDLAEIHPALVETSTSTVNSPAGEDEDSLR